MDSKAFISHTEAGGTQVSESVRDKLSRKDLEMEAFLSKNAIGHGEHIPHKILEFLIKTDLLFIVIESDVIGSKWVHWEYDFCKKRGIEIIPIVFKNFFQKLNKIDWFDNLAKCIQYDGNDGILRDEVYNTVDNKRVEIESRAVSRNKITLHANSDKDSYPEKSRIKISGNVKNSLLGSIILHLPSLDKRNYPPIISMDINTSITPDGSGDFTYEFDLPASPIPTTRIQTWSIEVKFDDKSQLIPISICPDSSTGIETGHPPTDSTKPTDSHKESEPIKQRIDSLSNGNVKSIPTTIKDQIISRADEISKLVKLLETKDRIVITGEKGSGKSVVLCQLYEEISKKYDTLFLRCDDYLGIESINELLQILDSKHPLDEILIKSYSPSQKLVIIFDSLDAISRNYKAMGIFKQFLKIIWGTNRAKTICSVRSYDLEYSPSIRTTDWGYRHALDDLTREQVIETLKQIGKSHVSQELLKILHNPLRLKLLSLILEKSPNADFTKIKNETELYERHWEEYVDKLEKVEKIKNSIYKIAEKMMEGQRTVISENVLKSTEELFELKSRNIVRSETEQLQFFHHAYLDYVLSRYVLTKYEKLSDFLKAEEYNIFLRPTIKFTLSLLYTRNKNKYFENVRNILKSDLKHYWKISTLNSLAELDDVTEQDVRWLGELLNSEFLFQRHFLKGIVDIANEYWFTIWQKSFFTEWFSTKNSNGYFLLKYVDILVKRQQYHQQIFNLVEKFVAKDEHHWLKKTAIEATASMSKVERSSWYLTLSSNESSYVRWGVLETIPAVINDYPEKIPQIFHNIVTYKEMSDEKTTLSTYGTFGMTSTKRQDNHQVIWRARELFLEILKKDPKTMIVATIKILETIRKDSLDSSKGTIVEDGACIWFDSSVSDGLYDENKLLSHIRNYLLEADIDIVKQIIPIIKKTRLAIFHSIILGAMSQNVAEFRDEIYEIISNPEVYKIETMRRNVRIAIKQLSPILSEQEISNLLEIIYGLRFTERELDDEDIKFANKIKAEFISEFPENKLESKYKEILNQFEESQIEYRPAYEFNVEVGKEPETKSEPQISDNEIIKNNIGKELKYRERIGLLTAISRSLDKKTEEINKEKISSIKDYLLTQIVDPDPEENSEDKDGSFMFYHDSIRGLSARSIIQLAYHTKDLTLLPIIKKLANDPINIVRGEIGRTLRYLFYVDYDLTFEIAEKYSKDPDLRVQFFLSDILQFIIHKNTIHATSLIQNILSTSPENYTKIQGVENFLLYLVFHKNEENARNLLKKIVEENLYNKELRENLPFVLKEHYLFDEKYQDKSLEIFYKLLDNSEHDVREKATFFLLNSFDKDEKIDSHAFIKKIDLHLEKIANEVDRRPWDPRIIEELVRFLEKHWNSLPEKTIDYLEKIVRPDILEYSAFQPVFADETVKILTGVFQRSTLTVENRNRCLAILDKFAIAGWDKALDLLNVMERPD